MSNGVTVTYNGNVIHQMAGNGNFKMNTAGAYMEGDVDVVVDVESGELLKSDNEPYIFRKSGGSLDFGARDREKDCLVGMDLVWNQYVNTDSASVTIPSGHVYYANIDGTKTIGTSDGTAIAINDGTKDNVIDLTATFGSTIANYIASLGSTNGVAWVKRYLPKDYYPYSAPILQNGVASSHDMVGLNQWNEVWESGGIGTTTGNNQNDSTRVRSKNYIRCLPNTKYYIYDSSNFGIQLFYYDADKNYIGYESGTKKNTTFTTGQSCHYLRFRRATTTIADNSICINIHSERDGEYEQYVKHSYPLDNTVDLHGIPMIDASGNLYADGDTYEADGTVTRRYTKRAYQEGDESLANALTDGTNTVVKLTTPTTETAEPFEPSQIVDKWGTEEYVTTGNVPIGHKTDYTSVKLTTKSITSNGTYNASDDNADGYSQVNVTVSGGGGILSGDTAPSASLGSDGDLYVQTMNLPDDVNFVEYLESSGTQYIDTGIVVTAGLDAYVKGISRGVAAWCLGVRNASTIASATIALAVSFSGTTSFYCHKAFGTAHNNATCSCSNGSVYENKIKTVDFKGTKHSLQINDSGANSSSRSDKLGTGSNNFSIVLFGVNTSGTITKSNGIAFSRVVFYDSGIPIHDYIPCLDTNNVACMWDNVEKEYVYNDGTGTFAYGSAVTPEKISDVLYEKKNGAWVVVGEVDNVNT